MNSALLFSCNRIGWAISLPVRCTKQDWGHRLCMGQAYPTNVSIVFNRGQTPCCATQTTIHNGAGMGAFAGTDPECDIDDDTSITGDYNSVRRLARKSQRQPPDICVRQWRHGGSSGSEIRREVMKLENNPRVGHRTNGREVRRHLFRSPASEAKPIPDWNRKFRDEILLPV